MKSLVRSFQIVMPGVAFQWNLGDSAEPLNSLDSSRGDERNPPSQICLWSWAEAKTDHVLRP